MTHAHDDIRVGTLCLPFIGNGWLMPWGEVVSNPLKAHIGIRFVPIPVATEEEFQTLAAELSRRLERMAVEAEKNEGGAA